MLGEGLLPPPSLTGGLHVGTIGGFSEVLSSSLPPSLVSFRGLAPRSSLFFDNGREARWSGSIGFNPPPPIRRAACGGSADHQWRHNKGSEAFSSY